MEGRRVPEDGAGEERHVDDAERASRESDAPESGSGTTDPLAEELTKLFL